MNKLYVLVAVAILTACAAPKKYSYYFDHTAVKAKEVKTEEQPSQLVASTQPAIVENTPTTIIKPSEEKVNVEASRKQNRSFKKEARQQVKSLVKEIKELKRKPEGTAATKADAKKNGFAIAGFVVSIVGFLLFWPLCIVGLILSAIGLKSERRGLAIAGLVVGVVALVIVLAIGAAVIGA